MTTTDTYPAGSVIAASLAPHAADAFDPLVRRMLAGTQEFVKQADGRWRPQGCRLGLCTCGFALSDLREPARD